MCTENVISWTACTVSEREEEPEPGGGGRRNGTWDLPLRGAKGWEGTTEEFSEKETGNFGVVEGQRRSVQGERKC